MYAGVVHSPLLLFFILNFHGHAVIGKGNIFLFFYKIFSQISHNFSYISKNNQDTLLETENKSIG